MYFMGSALHIVYRNNINFQKLHFDSKASLLRVISWVNYEKNDLRYAPLVLEEAYLSKNDKWNHTNYGPYIIEPDTYHSMLAEENILLFFVRTNAVSSEIFELANENMRSAGWDDGMLIPKCFYRTDL